MDKLTTVMDPQARYHRLGIIFLVAGLLAAGLVYRNTIPKEYESGLVVFQMDGDKISRVEPTDLKRYNQDTWTKFNMRAAEFILWAGSWCHGRRLAYTLVVLSIGGSLVCLFLAHFEFEVEPPRPSVGRASDP
jgi:alpha-beta hydrolase superfamily lysophospholipase